MLCLFSTLFKYGGVSEEERNISYLNITGENKLPPSGNQLFVSYSFFLFGVLQREHS